MLQDFHRDVFLAVVYSKLGQSRSGRRGDVMEVRVLVWPEAVPLGRPRGPYRTSWGTQEGCGGWQGGQSVEGLSG